MSTTRGSRKNRAVDLVVGVGSNRDREIGRNRESSREVGVRVLGGVELNDKENSFSARFKLVNFSGCYNGLQFDE